MLICTECYKKLYHQMFSPHDYTIGENGLISTCCGAEATPIDGRQYHKKVATLREEKRLRAWVNGPEQEGAA